MSIDSEQLSVTLEARIADFERNFRKAGRTADREFSQIESRGAEASRRLEGSLSQAGVAANFLSGALRGLIAGFTVETLISKMVAFNLELARTAENAKRVGMSTDAFQKLTYAGDKFGVKPEAVASGAAALADKANQEARDGEGELTRLLETNNLKLTDRAGKVRDVNSLLMDAARLIKNADSESDKVDIARLFGLTEDWVRALEQGPHALQVAQAEAVATGAVIDAELVRKATEFDAWWSKAFQNFAAQGKAAAVEVAGWIRQMAARMNITSDLPALRQHLSELEAGRAKAQGGAMQAWGDASIADAKRQIAEAEGEARKRAVKVLGELMTTLGKQAATGAPYNPTGPFGRLSGVDARAAPGGARTIIPTAGGGGGGGGGGAGRSTPDEYEREILQIERRTRALGGEAEAVGKSAFEAARAEAAHRLYEAAKNAGLATTPALTARVNELSDAYAKETTRLAEARLAHRQFVELQAFAGNSLVDVFKGALKGTDALVDSVKRLADSLLDAVLKAALLGQGPLAGLFGTGSTSNGGIGGIVAGLFGGFKFADGGFVSGPGSSRSDSIPARLSNGEFVMNAAATKKHRALLEAINSGRVRHFADGGAVTPLSAPAIKSTGAGGGAVTISPTINTTVNASGGTAEQNADLARQTSKQIEGMMRTVVHDELMKQMRPGNMLATRYGW